MKIIRVLWWYYFSKLIEFMDTFFFILRKNNHQITFLHVYHHATMLNIWWFVMNWVPCGHSYFGATLNSFIHVLMYSYYGLSTIPAMRPYLWWKKYITQGQLTQFVLTIFQTSCGVVWPCPFPLGWLYFQISYMISLIILFTNFYIQTYNKKASSRRKEYQNGSTAMRIDYIETGADSIFASSACCLMLTHTTGKPAQLGADSSPLARKKMRI
ncbi:elongation of very long chain fatty acids protein 5 isoform B [Alligator mississippiensis]|uniref:Elongation of very long chain fatty acids protein n=1 Tax=Alligator mississippiensis TaxID=8496 RepID=A0A151PDT4_ALLMI|nr:elongation of very long chain fatty acids protein 5 isoform B [Alligator mississippiensis]